MKDKVCKGCGYIGKPTTQGLGSFFVDGMLWLVFSSFTLFSAFFPLMLIPIGWTIFHLITYRTITCPKCENLDMVSLNSARGKKLVANEAGRIKPWRDTESTTEANHEHEAQYAK